MTITIPNELESFVQAKVNSGEFDSPETVVAAALTAWQGEEVLQSLDRGEVERLLLEAIDSPRIEWSDANIDRIIEGLREKHGGS